MLDNTLLNWATQNKVFRSTWDFTEDVAPSQTYDAGVDRTMSIKEVRAIFREYQKTRDFDALQRAYRKHFSELYSLRVVTSEPTVYTMVFGHLGKEKMRVPDALSCSENFEIYASKIMDELEAIPTPSPSMSDIGRLVVSVEYSLGKMVLDTVQRRPMAKIRDKLSVHILDNKFSKYSVSDMSQFTKGVGLVQTQAKRSKLSGIPLRENYSVTRRFITMSPALAARINKYWKINGFCSKGVFMAWAFNSHGFDPVLGLKGYVNGQ